MISGAHSIIYSTDPESDRAFFRDILKIPHVDVGEGWLIFELPTSELAVHPADKNNIHETYLMCDDVKKVRAELSAHNVPCSAIDQQSWGSVMRISLPGGGSLGVYQPRRRRPGSDD